MYDMPSKARQSDLREFRRNSLVVTDGQRVLVEATEQGTDTALIFPDKFPLFTRGDRLHLLAEERDWGKVVKVTGGEFLRVSELAEYITSRDAHWWAFTDLAILDVLSNRHGEIQETDYVSILLVKK